MAAPTIEAPTTTTEQAAPISLTDRAAQEVRDILEQQGNPEDVALRIYVAGGGCSGLQYGMALDENVEEGDAFFFDKEIKVVIDPMSLKYITGSIVDYVETAMGGGFKVENPNAVRACGCGSSFSTEDDEAGQTLTGGCGSCGSH
jgi:iron-sulfur cluster assembly accessory protein